VLLVIELVALKALGMVVIPTMTWVTRVSSAGDTNKTVRVRAGPGRWTLEELEVVIVEKSLCAVASASVLAISTPDFCLAAGIVYGGAEATCPSPY
jgi:hypothetical protein